MSLVRLTLAFLEKNDPTSALYATTFAVLGHLSKSKGRVTEEDISTGKSIDEPDAIRLRAIANLLKRPFVAVKKPIPFTPG